MNEQMMILLGLMEGGSPEQKAKAEQHLQALMGGDQSVNEYSSGVPGTGLDRQGGGSLPPGVGSPGQSFEGLDPNRAGAFSPGPEAFGLSAPAPERNPLAVQGENIDMRKMWR